MASSVQPNAAALITGGSRGIGYELAKLFARDGHDLVLVARERERLERVADEFDSAWGTTTTTLSKDLSRPESAREIFDTVERREIPVGVLVNNAAARPAPDRFEETAMDQTGEVLQTNVVTPTFLTKLFVQPMVERGAGRILNVSSVAGEIPDPRFGVYAATKGYVRTLSTVLARQLEPVGVTVTVLIPGWTDTDMAQQVFRSMDVGHDTAETMSPKEVARAGYDGLQRGQTEVIPGGQYRAAIQSALTTRASDIDT